jgi:DnaJ-class molecular chaperone
VLEALYAQRVVQTPLSSEQHHLPDNHPTTSNMPPHSDDEELFDEEPPTCEPYTVLGIEKTATPDEIKSAYRKAALKHHPGMHLRTISMQN